VVEIEHPAETLSPLHRVGWVVDGTELQARVCKTLMIAFGAVVSKEAGDRVLKQGFPKKTIRFKHSDFIERTKRSANAHNAVPRI
jgi:hypothetical protein